jgi:hypothetical protein
MGTQPPRYLAYLVRLWQVEDQGECAWRASAEDAHTGERRGFPDLASLFAFLMAQTERPDSRDDPALDERHPLE